MLRDLQAYAANTEKIYTAPARAATVVIIDPATDTYDGQAITGVGIVGSFLWIGIEYAPSVGKLYCAPHMLGRVLIVNPITNETDGAMTSTFFASGSPLGYCSRVVLISPVRQ